MAYRERGDERSTYTSTTQQLEADRRAHGRMPREATPDDPRIIRRRLRDVCSMQARPYSCALIAINQRHRARSLAAFQSAFAPWGTCGIAFDVHFAQRFRIPRRRYLHR